jgi:hypothetical protein
MVDGLDKLSMLLMERGKRQEARGAEPFYTRHPTHLSPNTFGSARRDRNVLLLIFAFVRLSHSHVVIVLFGRLSISRI